MKTRRLGRTGLKVTEICLGTMTFAHQCDEKTSFQIMDKATEHGVMFFDTADIYPVPPSTETAGGTEAIVGKWLKGKRDHFVLATKCRMKVGPDPNDEGLSRRHVMKACDDSLRRLQTDYIDLYQPHSPDPGTPLDETLRALEDLVRQGKVRYLGCSNYPLYRLAEAASTARALGLTRYETLQPRYNLLYREIETELLPYARQESLGVIVYNPIAGGLLSGKYRAGERPREGTRFTIRGAGEMYQHRYWDQTQLAAVEELAKESESRGLALAAVAVAWVLTQPGITSAIIGASRPDQLDATLAGAELQLDPELAKLCDAVWWHLPRRPVAEGYR